MSSLIDRAQRRPSASRREPVGPETTGKLLKLAFRPSAVAIALISVVVVVTLTASGSDLNGTFGAIAALWLAIHQVPLRIDGVTLGVLPLIPTAIMMYSVARGVAGASTPESSIRGAARIVGAAVAGPLVVTGLALAVAADSAAVIPLEGADPLAGFSMVLAVQGVAAAIGVVLGTRAAWRERIPGWLNEVVGPMLRAMLLLVAAGALATTVALLVGWQTVGDLLGREAHFVDVLGLTVLSVLYLPNMIVGAVAVLLGANASIGTVSVSVFGNIGGDLPPLPLLGAVPSGASGGFWPALLAVPIAIGVYFGRDCCRRATGQAALASVVVGAAGTALAVAAVAAAAGGELGVLGTVHVTWWLTGVLVFGWLATVGLLTAIVCIWIHQRRRSDSGQPAEPEQAALPGAPADEVPVIAEPESPELAVLDAEVVLAEAQDQVVETEPVSEPGTSDDDAIDAEIVDSEPDRS